MTMSTPSVLTFCSLSAFCGLAKAMTKNPNAAIFKSGKKGRNLALMVGFQSKQEKGVLTQQIVLCISTISKKSLGG